MFNERFDKILKRNLESVKPNYQPQAWDRFSKRLPAAGFWPFVQQYGGWVLCGMMMAGWLTTLYTLRENQEMIRQISAGQNQNVLPMGATAPSLSSNGPKTPYTTEKTDTVYIVRKTIVEHRHYTHAGITERTWLPLNHTSKLFSNANQVEASDKIANTANQNNILPAFHNDKKNIGNEPKEVLMQYAMAISLDSSQMVNSVRTDSIGRILDKETVIAMIDSAWAKQTAKQKLRVVYVDSVSERHPYALERQAPIEPKRPPFRLSSLQPRFGIESVLSQYSHGFGPSVEIFPTENLGVSFGLQASTLRAENHKALRDYNSATGKLFLVQYRSYLPLRFDRISDISIKTSVISLPVNLKYYIPLKNDLSLFVQSGTSLDISAYQQVNFESYLNQSKRRNTFEMDAKPHFFHDFMFGAGVQYQRSRILAQVSPYYVYDFRSIENTPAGSNFGLKASLWVNLYK